jgi:hypothetical protein
MCSASREEAYARRIIGDPPTAIWALAAVAIGVVLVFAGKFGGAAVAFIAAAGLGLAWFRMRRDPDDHGGIY